MFKLQRILLCLVILTLLLCKYNCKSETRRRSFNGVPPIGKRNFAYGKVMKAQDHTARFEEDPDLEDERFIMQEKERRKFIKK
ncbi:hypothetical protein ABFA07_007146 [Porites harrisoni]